MPDQVDQKFLPWRRTLVDLYTFARGLEEYVEIINRLPRLVLEYDRVALSDLLRPSYSPVLRQLGVDAAPVARSLGTGITG